MRHRDYVNYVSEKLNNDGFLIKKYKTNGFDAISARTNRPIWLSMLRMKLNVFVTVAYHSHVTKDVIEKFSKDSLDYSIAENKGLPRGTMKGIFSFAVLASENIDEEAKEFAKKIKKHFAAFESPVLFDLKSNSVHYSKKKPLWGRWLHTFREDFIEKYINPNETPEKEKDVWNIETKGTKAYGYIFILFLWASASLYAASLVTGYYETGDFLMKDIVQAIVAFVAAAGITVYLLIFRPSRDKKPKTL